jgi:molecular chaperone GrpE
MNDTPEEPANMSGAEQVDSAAQADSETNAQALVKAVADLKAENTELRDRLLRAIAEMENFRRRAEREKAEGMKYAVSEFARDVVSIGDNLRRAIEAVQKEAIEQDPALKTLIEGVEVTERELIKVFERHGVTRFDPIGEKFDPHNHEAMIKVDVPNVPAETIVQVLQAGYKIGDRILRPAAVIVAKGGQPADRSKGSGSGAKVPNGEAGSVAANADEFSHGKPGGLTVSDPHEHDPDVLREPTGVPKGSEGERKDRSAGEKRTSTVTQPVTENSGPVKKDDLISSFGKRLEGGS